MTVVLRFFKMYFVNTHLPKDENTPSKNCLTHSVDVKEQRSCDDSIDDGISLQFTRFMQYCRSVFFSKIVTKRVFKKVLEIVLKIVSKTDHEIVHEMVEKVLLKLSAKFSSKAYLKLFR